MTERMGSALARVNCLIAQCIAVAGALTVVSLEDPTGSAHACPHAYAREGALLTHEHKHNVV